MDQKTEVRFTKLEGEMTALKSDLKATLEGFRADNASRHIALMIWIAIVGGLIIAVVTGFNLYGGEAGP